MIEFTIYGQVRGGKNNMKIDPRTGHHYPEKKWELWRDQVVRDLRHYLNGIKHKPFEAPCRLEIEYWKGDLRRRDVPAMEDSLFHCFEKAGLIVNDSLFETVLWIWRGLDRKNPRVEVKVEEI